MISNDDLTSVYGFMKSTAEGNLRKMLVSGKMTDVHLRLLLKIVRGCSEAQFVEHCQKGSLPKLNLSAPEAKIRETFWDICIGAWLEVGLVSQKLAA